MNFDLFIGCFHHGEVEPFSKAIVEQIYAPYITTRDSGCLTLCFDKAGEACVDLYIETDKDMVDALNFNRPTTHIKFYEALLSLLRTDNLVLNMPGECPPLVGRKQTVAHLPAEMIATLGQPVVLRAAQEIIDWINRA